MPQTTPAGHPTPLSGSANRELAEWTPDGYTCPHCSHFNDMTSDEALKDMVGGDPTDSDYLECEHCRKEVKVTPDTVTSFRAEKI